MLVGRLRRIFSTHELLETIVTDNGTPFSSAHLQNFFAFPEAGTSEVSWERTIEEILNIFHFIFRTTPDPVLNDHNSYTATSSNPETGPLDIILDAFDLPPLFECWCSDRSSFDTRQGTCKRFQMDPTDNSYNEELQQ
ncbi:hypothetical protein ACTXT7_014289 [Hymenolepis weldensis]